MVKPLKENPTPSQENEYNEKLGKATPRAVRHLILIRHGQYNLSGITDSERYLTENGRKQAGFTGERLKALKLPLDLMIRSTMCRAQETGKIISTHITDVPIENCSLIEEGAPIAPQPPIGHWTPEPSVRWFFCVLFSCLLSMYLFFEFICQNYFHIRISTIHLKNAHTIFLISCSSFSRTVLALKPVFENIFIVPNQSRKPIRIHCWCAMLM